MIELLASEYRPYVQDALAYIVCFAALFWGATPERVIALTWIALFEIAPQIYTNVLGGSFKLVEIDVYYLSVDALAAVIWTAIALNANRNYPLFIAAMQVLIMAGHLARGMIEAIAPIAYATMVVAPGWIQLLILGAGVTRHILRKRKFGPYREWRTPVRWFGLLTDRSSELRL